MKINLPPDRTAGEKALDEINARLLQLLEVTNPETGHMVHIRCEQMVELLTALLTRFEGSYYFSGHDGLKKALLHPNERPFDKREWLRDA